MGLHHTTAACFDLVFKGLQSNTPLKWRRPKAWINAARPREKGSSKLSTYTRHPCQPRLGWQFRQESCNSSSVADNHHDKFKGASKPGQSQRGATSRGKVPAPPKKVSRCVKDGPTVRMKESAARDLVPQLRHIILWHSSTWSYEVWACAETGMIRGFKLLSATCPCVCAFFLLRHMILLTRGDTR